MEQPKVCPHCEEQKKQETAQEEFNLAVLLAIMPLVVMTFFSQVGLI